jgi:hypothetical protein
MHLSVLCVTLMCWSVPSPLLLPLLFVTSALEYIGYALMAPMLYGIVYLFCPTKAQRELRSDIMAKRRVRHKLYPTEFKEIETFNDLDDKYAQLEAQNKAKAAAASKKSQERSGNYKV